MSFNLFITKIDKKYYRTPKKLFLGKWCINEVINTKKIGDYEIVKYHWNDSEKLNKDYKFLYSLYYKLLKALTLKLNQMHQTNKKERYWHIIIGSWLSRYLVCSFDRWESISQAFDNFDISKIFYKQINYKNLIPSDISEFNKFTQTDIWNNHLISEIIKFNFKKINLEEMPFKENSDEKKYQLNKNMKNAPFYLKFLDKCISYLQKNPKLVLYKTYLGKENNVLLYLKTKTIPRLFLEFEKKINLPKPIDREKINFSFQITNEFEKFITKNIFKNLPVTYLEGYKTVDSFCKNISYNPELIISAMSDRYDLLSIWIADKTSYKTKYFFSEHGGIIEDLPKFDNSIKKSDCYLSWNLSDKQNTFQISPQFYTKKIHKRKLNDGKYLYIILTGTTLYNTIAHYDLKSDQFLETYDKLQSLKNLPNQIKDNLKFKLHPGSKIWSMKERIEDNFGKNMISKYVKMNDVFKTSKILLNIDFQTAFYESMNSGKPTIVYTDRKFTNNINPRIKKIFEKFVEENIIFDNFENLKKHLDKIWDDPLNWWESDTINNLKKEFRYCCSKNNYKKFSNEILELKNKYD